GLGGCAQFAAQKADPIQDLRQTMGSGAESTEGVKTAVVKAIPHADDVGKSLLDWASDGCDRIKSHWATATTQLGLEQQAKQQAVQDWQDEKTRRETVEKGWGYKMQVFVAKVWFWIKVVLALGILAAAVLKLVSARASGLLGTLAWVGLKGLYAVCSAGLSVVVDTLHFLLEKLVDWVEGWWSRRQERAAGVAQATAEAKA
ncbi:MAG: hypothetical protein ACM359_06795, partial [Bacillota bacterium]